MGAIGQAAAGIPKDVPTLQVLGAELAVAVAISSNPSAYLSDLVLNVISRQELLESFYDAFVNRLLLEKPDFYQDKTVILAFFTLLTVWINRGRLSNIKTMRREVTPKDEERYDSLLSLISTKNPTQSIMRYYTFVTPPIEGSLYYVRRKAF